jgi:hypothetical protein
MRYKNTIEFISNKRLDKMLQSENVEYLVINVMDTSNILISEEHDEHEFDIEELQYNSTLDKTEQLNLVIKELKDELKKSNALIKKLMKNEKER